MSAGRGLAPAAATERGRPTMALDPDLAKLSEALDAYHARLLHAQAEAPDEQTSRQLGALAAEVKQRQTGFLAECEKERQRIDRQLAEVRQRADAVRSKIAAAREQAAAAVAAALQASCS